MTIPGISPTETPGRSTPDPSSACPEETPQETAAAPETGGTGGAREDQPGDWETEAFALASSMDRLFRSAFGAMPKAAEVAEIKGLQASVCDLVRRAAAGGQTSQAEEALRTEENRKFREEHRKALDDIKRARADFLNYQERAARDLRNAEENILRNYVADLLPILDNFELTLADIPSEHPDPQRILQAVKMTSESFAQVLKVRGLEPVLALGKAFDPAFHEAVASKPLDPAKGEKPNQVVETCRTGYLWKGKLLRPAQVIVAVQG